MSRECRWSASRTPVWVRRATSGSSAVAGATYCRSTDDTIDSEYVKRAVALLEADDDLGYVCCWTRYFTDEKNDPTRDYGYQPIGPHVPMNAVGNVAGHAGSLIRRSLFSRGLWYSEELRVTKTGSSTNRSNAWASWLRDSRKALSLPCARRFDVAHGCAAPPWLPRSRETSTIDL